MRSPLSSAVLGLFALLAAGVIAVVLLRSEGEWIGWVRLIVTAALFVSSAVLVARGLRKSAVRHTGAQAGVWVTAAVVVVSVVGVAWFAGLTDILLGLLPVLFLLIYFGLCVGAVIVLYQEERERDEPTEPR